ncbi:hypothetical protein OJ998_08825 [Solirubrobacter taibaiensis]|nr:hypothetical protein [Solirubrobacter taibaiensis]
MDAVTRIVYSVRVPSREQEAKLLSEYERELAKALEDVETLTPIVQGLRRRVGTTPDEPEAEEKAAQINVKVSPPLRAVVERRSAQLEAQNELEPADDDTDLRTYRGRVTLTSFLRVFAVGDEPVAPDTIVARVAEAPPFRNTPPARNTILTRLNELANAGKLTKLEDGRYVRPRDSHGSGNPGVNAGSPRGRGTETTGDGS